ncbi:hypothetical protein ACFFSY_30570 [Paenibacillus aurantiacus]|uniref:DUF2642 domain-containing protein n=1 Tax=Paenibacillus aurantiacus TaxID=1936118 RepID=A0ABV5L0G3_9BACL
MAYEYHGKSFGKKWDGHKSDGHKSHDKKWEHKSFDKKWEHKSFDKKWEHKSDKDRSHGFKKEEDWKCFIKKHVIIKLKKGCPDWIEGVLINFDCHKIVLWTKGGVVLVDVSCVKRIFEKKEKKEHCSCGKHDGHHSGGHKSRGHDDCRKDHHSGSKGHHSNGIGFGHGFMGGNDWFGGHRTKGGDGLRSEGHRGSDKTWGDKDGGHHTSGKKEHKSKHDCKCKHGHKGKDGHKGHKGGCGCKCKCGKKKIVR